MQRNRGVAAAPPAANPPILFPPNNRLDFWRSPKLNHLTNCQAWTFNAPFFQPHASADLHEIFLQAACLRIHRAAGLTITTSDRPRARKTSLRGPGVLRPGPWHSA